MTRQELEQIKALILQLSTKISSLPETTTLAGEDLFTIAKSEVGGVYTSKKMKMNVLAKTLKTRYPEINGSRFAGLASPRDEAFTPPTTTSLFWIAYTPGTYSAYGNIVVGDTPLAIVYDITTQQFSSLPLWEASSGTVKFAFAEDTIVDNQVISQKIAVSYGNEYDFELNIQPTDSYEKIIVRQYNFNDVMLDVREYDTIRPKVTPVKNASYIVFAVTYRDDNPVSAQNSYLLLTAPISVLANDVYSYVSVLADKVLPDVWPWEAISGLPTTLEGYGITDAVDTTTFTTVLQSYYTKTESDTRFQPAGYYVQRTDLRYLHFVAGAFEADEFIQGITEKTIKVPTATAHLTNNGANGVNPFVTQGDIDTSLVPINALIPNQASSENQLADKAFVNSSIATNTANFKGTYNSVEALANITGADANDYAFVSSVDIAGNTLYSRYKYSSGSWLFEYTLNNSSFTSDQWAAINSGITDSLVTKLSALPTNDALTTALAGKVDVVYGKGLSTNDFTDTYLDYMSGLTTSNVYLAVKSFVGDVYQGVVLHNKVKNVLTNVWSSSEINLSDYYQDRESGKGLSTNDYTNEEKTKLGALPTKAQLDASLDEKVDKSGKETKDEIFIYQHTGGGLTKNVKNSRVVSYKGKTLAWNQVVQNGNFANGINSWVMYNGNATLEVNSGIMTATLTQDGVARVQNTSVTSTLSGHVFLLMFDIKATGTTTCSYKISTQNASVTISENWQTITRLYTSNGDSEFVVGVESAITGNTFSLRNVVLFDLTLMFGAGNEPTTVEEFESLFPESYYDYNAGTLISNEAKEIETVGFNQWDEEWEEGRWDYDSFTKRVSSGEIRCANAISVLPNTDYYFRFVTNADSYIMYFDANYNFITRDYFYNTHIFRTPAGARYITFFQTYSVPYDHDICINISDPTRNGQYEPYRKSILPLNLNKIRVISPNVWDEEWENGGYNYATGTKISDSTAIRCASLIKVEPNTNYYGHFGSLVGQGATHAIAIYYDVNKNYITYEGSGIANRLFITPSNCAYISFYCIGTTYNHDICINKSDPGFNGRYFPYGTIEIEGGLKSAGSVYDEIVGNKYIKRVGSVDLGTLEWAMTSGEHSRMEAQANGIKSVPNTTIGNLICSKYTVIRLDYLYDHRGDKIIAVHNSVPYIWVYDSAYSDADTFKTAMSGVMLYYELATPIEYDLIEPVSTDYPVDKLGTERVISDNICPIRVSTEYHEANISDIQVENITDYLKKAELKKELNTELTKLAGVETGAQVNDIEHIKIGSTEQTISEKTVSLPASYPKANIADVAINNKTELKANQEFKFRKTNVDWDAKTEIVKKIYGKTLAWNQLVVNGNFANSDGWSQSRGSISVSNNICTYTASQIGESENDNRVVSTNAFICQSGHKYYMMFDMKAAFSSSPGFVITNNSQPEIIRPSVTTTSNSWNHIAAVFTPTNLDGECYLWLSLDFRGQSVGSIAQVKNANVVDLTLLYGSEIDGMTDAEILAKFESEFPGYHSYEPGKLISNDAKSIETVGFNLWDEEWEVGIYETVRGTKSPENQFYRTVNFVHVLPSTEYYYKVANTNTRVFFYGTNHDFISSDNTIKNSVFTTPAGCYYITFFWLIEGSVGSPCINLSDPAKNGTYEPYWKRECPLNLNNIKVHSHNIWDEEWEVGTLTNGLPIDANDTIRSKNFCAIMSNTQYYLTCKSATTKYFVAIAFYDSDKTYISSAWFTGESFTTLANAKYFKLFTQNAPSNTYGGTYLDDICLNISGAFNGQYEPHGDIIITGGLKSAGSARDEIVGNKYVKRVGEVDLGALTWTKGNNTAVYGDYFFMSGEVPGSRVGWHKNVICSQYVAISGLDNNIDKTISINSSPAVCIQDSSYSDAVAFKTAMSGVPIYYELATPIEYELAEPMQSVVKVSQYGTESVVYEDNDVHAPFIADIQYGANSDDIIDNYDGVVKSLKNKLETLWNAVFNNS